MRKAFCALSLIMGMILSSACLTAQERVYRPVEFNLSAGGPHGMVGTMGGPNTTFSAMAEVRYTPVKMVSLGLVGGLHDHSRSLDLPPEPGVEDKTHYDCNLMLMVYGNWLTRERWRLYSSVGYGTMGGFEKSEGVPACGFQFTPLGFSYGGRIYGFAELGMGWMFWPARAGIGIRLPM